MKTRLSSNPERGSALIAFFLIAAILGFSIASVSLYVSQSTKLVNRRDGWNAAYHYAESGVTLAMPDIYTAFTNTGGTFLSRLAASKSLTTNGSMLTITYTNNSFTNQPVTVQFSMTNSPSPAFITVVATATRNGVTQTNSAYVDLAFGWGGAIVSDSPGSSGTGTDKGTAQDGNVVITGPPTSGRTVIDGGIIANGRVNFDVDPDLQISSSTISMTNYGTAGQIPDYTLEGSPDQLFDFNQFIIAASNTPSAYLVGGVLTNKVVIPAWRGTNQISLTNGVLNYFTNLSSFIAANNWASTNPVVGNALEGVVVVNISSKEMGGIDSKDLPNGINVRGTLVFNFGTGVSGSDKLVNSAAVNVNKADLSGLNVSNTATFTSGYPPTFVNTNRNPRNPSISAALIAAGKPAFGADDDLPAMMYNVGIFDLHGPVNICGACYTPSFMEIENKQSGQIQYFKGMLIVGGGVIVDEQSNGAKNIVSYDASAVDRLATSGTRGKTLKIARRF